MSDIGWNSIEISEDECPRVTAEDLREMMADLDPEDFDEPVQEFLAELEHGGDPEDLRRAATLLLQDEVDFSPELQAAGIEPDEQLIALLLAVGADTNAANAYGEPPLHLAARYGYARIVEMLLAAGADTRLHNAHGKLAAELALDPELVARLTPPQRGMSLAEEADEPHECSCGHTHEHAHECRCGHGSHCSCEHDHDCDCGC